MGHAVSFTINVTQMNQRVSLTEVGGLGVIFDCLGNIFGHAFAVTINHAEANQSVVDSQLRRLIIKFDCLGNIF